MDRESLPKTFLVATSVCLVCATLVSTAAVGLRGMQESNRVLDIRKNILIAAGKYDEDAGTDVNAVFESLVIDRIIDLETGNDVTAEYENPAMYDQIDTAAGNDDDKRLKLDSDPATIKQRENHSHVYLVKTSDTDETPAMYVFPIRGKGLWSILKGFIAIDADLNTIVGLTYYEHGETPGLGARVDEPEWKQHWVNKELFDADGQVAIQLVKGDWEDNPHAVDSLSGATVTSRGVEKMLHFWMGEQGFQAYLEQLKKN